MDAVLEYDINDSYYSDEDLNYSSSTFELVITIIFFGVVGALKLRDYLRRRHNQNLRNNQQNGEENQPRNYREIVARRIEEVRRGQTSRECVVCLENDARYAILTNCGHIFCCSCIIGYWRHSASIITPVNCPTCRAPVSMILPLNWSFEVERENAENPNEHQENNIALNDYNRRFSTERPWMDYVRDLPVLIPYIIRNIFDPTGNGIVLVFRIRMAIILLAMSLYLISPLDIIPEGVHGFFGSFFFS
ncbi:hypothetical protein WR25_18667 isoform B [Diploscapter pachys]|uniref:E3 ubiquitin-protein ligase RNF170 n=1 Tax=Diploscapter pachys TaxID=2018661 RepID=A0A2A2L226_9BILA|nr:hypothetical protein WR25_18667 isoform B [Diploscapter pachys]